MCGATHCRALIERTTLAPATHTAAALRHFIRCPRQAGFDPSPVPEPDLQLLYSSDQNYVDRFAAAALQSVKDGYLRPADGVKLTLDDAHAAVP